MWNNWDQEHWMSSEEIRLFSFLCSRERRTRQPTPELRSPSSQSLRTTERVITINCMVAAFAIAALLVSLIYGLT
jgi:hypothetical protein